MKSPNTEFVKMMASLPGHESAVEAMLTTESPVAVRFNPAKVPQDIIPKGATLVPWEPWGVYLDHRPQFTFMPELYDGIFYVQDPSSMIIGEVIRRLTCKMTQPVNYLDACAAPGGKTISALSTLPEGSFVLANEFEHQRCKALIDNLERWGYSNYAVSRNDARKLDKIGKVFDIVATDVPCSGEGMMRKNETAIRQWSPKLVEDCARLQREIVEVVWRTLRPGGFLIYSTCTFNTVENEGNAQWIKDVLGGEPVDLNLSEFPGVLPGVNTDIPCARFVPGKVDGEGQFVAVFRKPGNCDETAFKTKTNKTFEPTDFPGWLKGNFVGLSDDNGIIYAIERTHEDFVNHLISKTTIILPGIHVCSPKGLKIVPAQALANSVAVDKEDVDEVEVDYRTALEYLRGEVLRLPSEMERGHILVTYKGCHLGWVNNIGTRANNLFPDSKRIRSSHLPDTPPNLFREII